MALRDSDGTDTAARHSHMRTGPTCFSAESPAAGLWRVPAGSFVSLVDFFRERGNRERNRFADALI